MVGAVQLANFDARIWPFGLQRRLNNFGCVNNPRRRSALGVDAIDWSTPTGEIER